MPHPDAEGHTAGLLDSPEGYLDLSSKAYMDDTEPADTVQQCSLCHLCHEAILVQQLTLVLP